ncbi:MULTISPECIES: Zn-ribbon domain-containing OB-fold protein [unclassified Achromobacter]|uniref:Zn-ribbon domain-containing OB-fold protein n=1 Tax=unclassified Achromobacter TaxID=2626865 RepID=UPI000B51C225|nr:MULTISPECIES: OB-fold domain-containing protein [unclassified Achromobacter]OWT71564.1 hypothetical protein CEY05_25605 [Achromobacter sp. HZ34]OWT73221.1 hypothetical protein CEY04_24440 [Achromobacter sp. HZ28]
MHLNDPAPVTGSGFDDTARPLNDLAPDDTPRFEIVDGKVMLRGSVSRSSGCQTWPRRTICPQTGARDMEPQLFGPYGMLYSYASIHVSATRAVPYTLGYVDFPDGLRVLLPVHSADALAGTLPCDVLVELHVENDAVVAIPLPGGEQAGQATRATQGAQA